MCDTLIARLCRPVNLIISGTLFALLGACYPAGTHSFNGASTDLLAADVASCKKKAGTLMDRELRLDASYDRSGGDPLEIAFAQFDAHKQLGRYFDNCMSGRRYKRTE